jgi:predicted phosphodiesterase
VHGNVHALEAVLADVAREEVDVVVFGGDVFAGPFPRESLELARSVPNARYIVGNADRKLPDLPEDAEWVHAQLDDDLRGFVASFEPRLSLEIAGLGPTRFSHGSPRSDTEIVTRITPDERLRPMLDDVPEQVVVIGHTHVQFDRIVDGVRIVNAGSVGMPYEDRPGAYWALLGPEVDLRRTGYDLRAAAGAISASDWPGADEFARENVLEVPSPEEASELFEKMATES